jgi:tetratricopeptide (TPR) repeat protein
MEVVEKLGSARNWAALTDVITSAIAPCAARERAIDILEREKNQDELLPLLRTSGISPQLQLRACKAIVKLGDLRSISEQLDSFFAAIFTSTMDASVATEGHRLRADFYFRLTDYERAVQEYDEVLKADPDDEWVLALRGNCCRLLGRYDQAMANFNASLDRDPDDPWDLIRRGLTLYAVGDYRRARQDFAKALDLGSTESHFLDEYADSLLQIGDLDKALEVS